MTVAATAVVVSKVDGFVLMDFSGTDRTKRDGIRSERGDEVSARVPFRGARRI